MKHLLVLFFLPVLLQAQSGVTFNSSDPTVCSGVPVSFTNTTPNAVSCFWHFGDGGTSASCNPSYVYPNPGVYDVKLIVTYASNAVDSVTAVAYVSIYPVPMAAFTSDISFGCVPVCVNFTDASVIGPTDVITSWSWSFGDNSSSTFQNPAHCYVSPGTYTPALTVTSSQGCTGTISMTNYISVYPIPVAAFTYNVDSLTVYFTDMSLGGSMWYWSFGDPMSYTSTVMNPVYQYQTPGTYTVTLIVTSADGCSDTIVQPVIITDVADVHKPVFDHFPCPANESLSLRFPAFTGEDEVLIYDITGRMICSNRPVSAELKLDVSNIADGEYFLEYRTPSGSSWQKFLIAR